MPVLPSDIIIDGVGYMVDVEQGGNVTVQDLQPGTARATDGEADFISYEAESSHQVSDFSGGAGQARHVNTSSWLTGIGDGSFGNFYPPRKALTASGTGGTNNFYFRRSGTLYGFISSNIEQIESSNTFSTLGVGNPIQQPVVTGGGNVFWTSTSARLARWPGSGTAVNITPAGFTPTGTAAFGRHLFCFATRTVASSPTQVQRNFASSQVGRVAVTWSIAPTAGNVLIACVVTTQAARVITAPPGWDEVASEGSDNIRASVFISTNFVAKGAGSFSQGSGELLAGSGYSEAFEVRQSDGSIDTNAAIMAWTQEVEGLQADNLFDSADGLTATSTTTLATGTISPDSGDYSVSFMAYGLSSGAVHAIGHSVGWAEQDEQSIDNSAGTISIRAALAGSAGNPTSDSTTLGGTADTCIGIAVALNKTAALAGTEQFLVLGSSDEGATWILAPGDFSSTVIGEPKAFLPFDNALWFSTEYGLYQMRYAEREYSDGTRTLNIAIVQAATFAGVNGSPGSYMVAFEGGVFFGLGDTLYRYTQGGGLESIWPTGSFSTGSGARLTGPATRSGGPWATVGGELGALTVAGDSLYFGGGIYLWKFSNGRSFHPIASGGDYTHMAWNDGKLYFTADPAQYYDFGNPALRPDINSVTATNVTTGYLISSLLDFHKVNLTKLISHFEAQVRYSTASGAGTVTWDYIDASGDGPDPGRSGGGATGLAWITIGTHTQGDDSPKVFDLSPIIVSKAIYIRATLTPGASGYPYLVYYSPVGRAHPPVQRRFLAPLLLKVGLRDKNGTQLYDTEADVQVALSALQTLRSTPAPFDLIWDDGTAAGETVTVTMTALAIQKVMDKISGQKHLRAVATLDELP